jgi:hypothetical protein
VSGRARWWLQGKRRSAVDLVRSCLSEERGGGRGIATVVEVALDWPTWEGGQW